MEPPRPPGPAPLPPLGGAHPGERPAVGFDFADAWHGGSSLLVDGALDAPAEVDLYATRLPAGPDTVVELTHRTDAGTVAVELAIAVRPPDRAGDPPPYTYLPVPAGTGWRTVTAALTGLTGTVHALGVRLTGTAGPVRWRLGGLAVRGAARPVPAAPTGLRITGASGGDLRFAWSPARSGACATTPSTASSPTAPGASSAAPASGPSSRAGCGRRTASAAHGSNCAPWGSCTPHRRPPS